MEKTDILTDDQRQVLSWLRGGYMSEDVEMAERFIDLVADLVIKKLGLPVSDPDRAEEAIQRRLRRERMRERGVTLSVKALMTELGIKPKEFDLVERLPAGKDAEPGTIEVCNVETVEEAVEIREKDRFGSRCMDSADLALAVLHMGHLEGRDLNNSLIQLIIYIAYGVMLADSATRMTSDHPQMWQFGPVFPRAYNKLRKDRSNAEGAYGCVKLWDREVFDILQNCFRRFGWNTASSLSAVHMAADTPWAKTKRENPDKWGVPMDDDLIRDWFCIKSLKSA